MLFGIEWDTSSHWAFAVSIFPILMKGLLVTLQATVVGFFIAMVLGLVLAADREADAGDGAGRAFAAGGFGECRRRICSAFADQKGSSPSVSLSSEKAPEEGAESKLW